MCCVEWQMRSLFGTSLLVVWQHRYSCRLLQHTVTSNHVPTVERSPTLFLFLLLPISQRQTETNNLCILSYLSTNTEAKRDIFSNLPLKVFNMDWFILFFFSFTKKSHWDQRALFQETPGQGGRCTTSHPIVKCNIYTMINNTHNKTEEQLLKHWLLK